MSRSQPVAPGSRARLDKSWHRADAGGHNARPKSTALPGQAPVTQAEYEALQLAQVKELWNNFGELVRLDRLQTMCLAGP